MIKKVEVGQIILNIFFVILCVAVLLPFVMLVGLSLSKETDIANYGYSIFPRNIDFTAYKYVFKNPQSILNAYKVTGIFSVVSMALGVLLMSMIAYPLSRTDFKARGKVTFYLYFTMLFNGGLVPTFILITQYLHLDNTIWVYILPGLISPWYVFIIRSFFQGHPPALIEAARIDGASEFRTYWTIIMPISKPVLATIALMVFLGKWNDWNTAMLYITNDELISLQYLLQRIMKNLELLQNPDVAMAGANSTFEIPSETVRMAMAVVVAGPALVVFPFFQKYFVRGLTVGSVKG